jgi:amidase
VTLDKRADYDHILAQQAKWHTGSEGSHGHAHPCARTRPAATSSKAIDRSASMIRDVDAINRRSSEGQGAMNSTVHAFGDDALGELDAVGVAAWISSGEISQIEAVEAAIARVQRVNPHLNAVQVEAFDRALAYARADPKSGPFAGVPSFIKDNVDVSGLPTCYGSSAFTPHPAKHDGPPATQFLSQGFALLGKTTMPEYGLTASTEYADRPPTRNPWNTGHSAGASSGGSGALVGAGAVPIAHGNDGGGSIRIPAAVNGLVGLKTTRGRFLDQV